MEEIKTTPSAELFEDVEEHSTGGFTIRIEFYKTAEGRYFVWPYIRKMKGDVDITKHFPVHGHFADRDIARHAAITQGEVLIEAGFDPDRD